MHSLRNTKVFYPSYPYQFKLKALKWVQGFTHSTYLTGNEANYPEGAFDNILAAGCYHHLSSTTNNSFNALKEFHDLHQDWLFGYLGYDLKNETEKLYSNNPDRIQMPEICFYQPYHILFFQGNEVRIHSLENPDEIWHEIHQTLLPPVDTKHQVKPAIQRGMSRYEYLNKVTKILEHIRNGDIYEMNFCMEFFVENYFINPLEVYLNLTKISPMPFSVLQKTGSKYLICASPERFLKKNGTRLLSQPIKGTKKRGHTPEDDYALKNLLLHDEKERAENMMIVDLVRNDLARSAVAGTVKVKELFGIYAFPQVFQMISSVEAHIKPHLHFVDALRHAFPMGSMTGAPKIKVMELIERYENSKRGLFSGAAGYITPHGNFDFNVVIRSILYDQNQGNLSFHVGSAITHDAIPKNEYEECLLKAKAIREVLTKPMKEKLYR